MDSSLFVRAVSVVCILTMVFPAFSTAVDLSSMKDQTTVKLEEMTASYSAPNEVPVPDADDTWTSVSEYLPSRSIDTVGETAEPRSHTTPADEGQQSRLVSASRRTSSISEGFGPISSADDGGVTEELDRTPWEDSNGPDITILSYSLTPSHSNHEGGRSFTVTATIKNNRPVSTGQFWVSLWLDWRYWNVTYNKWEINGVDLDTTEEGENWLIYGTCLYEADYSLGAYGSRAFTYTTIAPQIAPGNHYVELHADHHSTDTQGGGSVIESEEDNNWAPYGPTYTAPMNLRSGSFAFIEASCAVITTGAVGIGQSINMRYVAMNYNPYAAWVQIGASLIMGDIKIGGPDNSGPYLIPAGQSLDLTLALTIPSVSYDGGDLESGYYNVYFGIWDGPPGDTVSSVYIDECVKYYSIYIDVTQPLLFRQSSEWRFEYGTSGNSVAWTASDLNPYWYWGYIDGSYVCQGPWTGAVSVPVDAFTTVGTHSATVYVKDSCENVATDTVSFEILEVQKPDLVVADFAWTDAYGVLGATITSGQPFDVTVVIDNVGTGNAVDSFNVRVSCADEFDFTCEVSGLPAGVQYNLVLQGVHMSSVGIHEVHVFVDPENTIEEEHEYESWTHFIFLIEVQRAEWTVLVYLSGDDDRLNVYAEDDWSQLGIVGSTGMMSIICLADSYQVGGGDTGLVFFRNPLTTGYMIYPNPVYYRTEPAYLDDPLQVPWLESEMNLGLQNTFQQFALWGTETFQAENYILVIMGHGAGTSGPVAPDKTSANDGLTLKELRSALLNVPVRFDIIGFDACQMGTVEVIYQLRDCADIMVGSEETEAGFAVPLLEWLYAEGGWPYFDIFNELKVNLNLIGYIDPETLASRIVEHYDASWLERVDISTTMGAFRVFEASTSMRTALDALANQLIAKMLEFYDEIVGARIAADQYSIDSRLAAQPLVYHAFADIRCFASEILNRIDDEDIRLAAQMILDAYDTACIDYCSSWAHPLCKGLSVYFPYLNWGSGNSYTFEYNELDFSNDTVWNEFLLQFVYHDPHLTPHRNYVPNVEIIGPEAGQSWQGITSITWSEYESDFDWVRYRVCLTTNGGATWQELRGWNVYSPYPTTLNLLFRSLAVDSALFTDSDYCHVRIEYDDGWNGIGEVISGTFSIDNIPNHVPVVRIQSPSESDEWSDIRDMVWYSSDVDSDTVQFDVDISADGGVTWSRLLAGILSMESSAIISHQWALDTNSHPNSRLCVLRVYYDDFHGGYGYEESGVFTIENREPTSLLIDLPLSDVPYSTDITVLGVFSLAITGYDLELQCSYDEITWSTLATVPSTSNGNLDYVWTRPDAAKYYLRWYFSGDEVHQPAWSDTTILIVNRANTYLTIACSSLDVIRYDTVVIGCWMVPSYAELDNTWVRFYWTADQSSWVFIDDTYTSDGYCQVQWTCDTLGSLYVKAEWDGDQNHNSAESNRPQVLVNEKYQSTLTTLLSSQSGPYDVPVDITAVLNPRMTGKLVIIEYFDEDEWVTIGSDYTDDYGELTTSFAGRPGPCSIRSRWAGDSRYFGAISDTVILELTDPYPPEITSRGPVTCDAGTTGNYLAWGIDDACAGGTYEIRNAASNELLSTGYWTTGIDVTYCADGLNPNFEDYRFKIVAFDANGISSSNTESVHVYGNTPTGTDVSVFDQNTDVSVIFEQVLTPGITSIQITTGPPPPAGFHVSPMKRGGFYVQIVTTATFAGRIEVAIPYDETLLTNPEHENQLEMQHWTASSEDRNLVTTWIDTENNIVYGEVTDLSIFAILEDVTPPETEIAVEGIEGLNGWHVSAVEVSFTATDHETEVAATAYSFDGVNWLDYDSPFYRDDQGIFTIYYRSVDAAGNIEPMKQIDLHIDRTPPAGPDSYHTSGCPNSWISLVTIYVEWAGAFDEHSSVYGYSYEWSHSMDMLPDQTIDTLSTILVTTLDSGIWYLHIRTCDAAGNWADDAYHIGPFKIDTDSPTTSVHLEGPAGMNDWYLGSVQITILAEDSLCGVDYIMYSLDNGPWLVYSGRFSVSGDQVHQVGVKAVDYANNWCNEEYVEFVIDTTPPSTAGTVTGTTNPDGVYLNTATVSLIVEDNLNLYSHTDYRIDGGSWRIYTGPFTVQTDGHHWIDFFSVDYAGNVEVVHRTEFDVVEVGFFYDDFTSASTGYDPSHWTQETYGTGSFYWDGVTIYGLTASGHGHRTLVSAELFQPNVRVTIKGRMTNYASWEPAVCFGWTDRTPSDWNYHFLDGQNGVWLELNWPQQDYFMLYSKRNGVMSELRVYVDFTQYHEYELWWTTGAVVLYIDGEIYERITSNVPNVPLRYKMTVTAWSGNTPNEWLYLDYVDIGQIQVTPDSKILAIGDNQGKVRLFRVDGMNPPVQLWTKQLSGTLVEKVVLADLDQNGKNEVLACTNAGAFYCLDSVNGDILWQWSQSWSGFTNWAGIFVAELDGDGYLEIVTALNARTTIGGGVIVLEHTGAVKTIRVSPITGGHNGNGPDEIELGDFNGDGVDDIACLYGSHLYSGSQPMIEVVDVSSGSASVLWNFRYGGFGGSGMTNFELAYLDGDGIPDYVTAGWWCPVGAFGSHGQLMWTNPASGGNADKVALYSANMNGLGAAGLVLGTGAYSNTGGLYMYFVNPVSGGTLASIPLGIVASDFRPWTIANIDADPALEIIASCNIVGSASDRLIVLDGASRSISWYATIECVSQFFLPYDLNGDSQSEVLAPDGNGISLFDGYGSRIWNTPIGAIAYTQSIARILTEAAPKPPTPVMQDLNVEDEDGELSLSWMVDYGSGTTISHYEIQVSDVADFSRIRGTWYPEDDATSQSVMFLMPAEYFFRMRAMDVDCQLGEWSNVESIFVTRDNTVPIVDAPSNVFYEDNSPGHSVTWNPFDATPDHYVVYRDGYMVQSGMWSGGAIPVVIDGLSAGNYSLTAVVYDRFSNWQADTLFITVLPNETPIVEDATASYEVDTTGHTMVWMPYDYTPSTYEIWFSSILLVSDTWDGGTILLIVDGLDPGTHEFTLVLYDATGLFSSALGTVYVVDTKSPVVVAPEDRTVEAGSYGIVLTWTASEPYPASFSLSLDGVVLASGSWDGSSVPFTVDYPSVGVHEYTMTFVDQNGNSASAPTRLTVVDTTSPVITGPSSVEYEAGRTGNEILWIPSDLHPAYHFVYLNGVTIQSGHWDGSPITLDIDGHGPGEYAYILTCVDLYNNMASHAVVVTVKDTTPPMIAGPADLTYEAGVIGHTLSWSFTDLYPDSHSILKNGAMIASGPWTGLEVVISVDLLNPGTYNYTFVALDDYGNRAAHTVWVTVLGNTPAGTDVEVPDPETGVVLTFDETTSPGTTSVDITETGPHPPDNFRLMGLYYNITTTANYEGLIIVAIPYDESLVNGLEKNLKLWHWKETAGWEDVTLSVDEVNNIIYGEVASLSLFAVMEDCGPPVTSITLSGVGGWNGWFVSDVAVELTAYDDVSEIAEISYSLDEGAWTRYEAPFQVIREGLTTVRFRSADVAGNVEATQSLEIWIDKSAPSTELIVGTPSVIEDAIYVSSTTPLTLAATDLVSGPCSVSYRIDGGAWQEYAVPLLLLAADGPHVIEFYCVDTAGNHESAKAVSLIVDNSCPYTLLTYGAPSYVNFVTSATLVTLTASDAGSGVATVFYQIDGQGYQVYSCPFSIVAADGAHLVQSYSVDRLGNVEEIGEQVLILDNSGPATESGLAGIEGENDWYISPVTVSLQSDDGLGSGVSIIYFILDSNPTAIYCEVFEVSEDGYHMVQFWAEDLLGNSEASTGVRTFRIDTCTPTSAASLAPSIPNGLDQWYVTSVVVTIEASDLMSGVDGVYYSISGESTLVYANPLEILGEGYYVIQFWSMDVAGNGELPSQVSFKIDKTTPTTSLTIGDPKHGEEPVYVRGFTEFALSSSDSVSGLASTEYRIDEGVWVAYSGPFCVATMGLHVVYYRSTDIAGNSEAEHSITVVADVSQLTYVGETTGNYSDPVALQAVLIDVATQQPMCGKEIMFAIGTQSVSSVTDSYGMAFAAPILTQAAGDYVLTATYGPDSDHLGASDSKTFVICHETALVTYTGMTVVPTTASGITLRATLTNEDDGYWGDMSLISVTFFIYSVPIDLSAPVAVVGPIMVEPGSLPGVGVAVAEVSNLPENGYLVLVRLEAEYNPYFEAHPSDLVSLTVYEPTGDFVTGGGWIVDSSDGKGNFGFNVHYRKTGLPRGQSIYVYRVGEWEYIVKSNAWIGMAIDGNHAFFEGKCVVQKFNSETGELAWAEGNYQFRVDVWDNDESGGIDAYQIRVLDKNGLTYHEAGVSPVGYLQGGNITIHVEKTK